VKENVLDVLMYLFENYMDEGPDSPPDQETLTSELTEAGFARSEISKAFSWLETLPQMREQLQTMSAGHGGMRHYHPAECTRLDKKCRGFLQQMESAGVLDPITRELVLDRMLALGNGDVSIEQLKWVTWMVLFHQPGQEYAHSVLEELVFDDRDGYLH
jgi:Smg protein